MKELYLRFKTVILYGFFGILTTAVNYGAYYLLVHLMGLPLVAGNGIAWLAAVLFAFVTNKLYVFESKSLRASTVVRELFSFIACRLFSGLLDMAIMVVFVDFVHLNDLVIKVLANIVVIIINYALSKTVIFAQRHG